MSFLGDSTNCTAAARHTVSRRAVYPSRWRFARASRLGRGNTQSTNDNRFFFFSLKSFFSLSFSPSIISPPPRIFRFNFLRITDETGTSASHCNIVLVFSAVLRRLQRDRLYYNHRSGTIGMEVMGGEGQTQDCESL